MTDKEQKDKLIYLSEHIKQGSIRIDSDESLKQQCRIVHHLEPPLSILLHTVGNRTIQEK